MEVTTQLLSSHCANASETSLSQPPGEKQAFGNQPEQSSAPCSPSPAPTEDAEPAWPPPPQPWHCAWHCSSPGGRTVSLSCPHRAGLQLPARSARAPRLPQAALLPSAPETLAPGWGPRREGRRGAGLLRHGAAARTPSPAGQRSGWWHPQAGGTHRLLHAWSRTQPGLPARPSPFLAVREPKGCVSPQASALLITTSVDHGAFYRDEAPRSPARRSADSRPPHTALRLRACRQRAAAEETSTERVADVIY